MSSSSVSLSESAASRGVSLKVSYLWTVQWSYNSTCLHFGVDGEWVLLILYNLKGWRRFQLLMILSRCRLIWWVVLVGHNHHQFCNLHHGTLVLWNSASNANVNWAKRCSYALVVISLKQSLLKNATCTLLRTIVDLYVPTLYIQSFICCTAQFETPNNLSSSQANA